MFHYDKSKHCNICEALMTVLKSDYRNAL